MFKKLILAACFVISSHAANSRLDILIQDAKDKKLWQSPTWIKLVHYRKNLFGSGHESDIRSSEFFLSGQGKTSPKEELLESLKAFHAPIVKEKKNEHALCRYPARLSWLEKELNWQSPQIECSEYLDWTAHHNVESIGLIFATGYFSNPASFFGHPLIKFNIDKGYISKNLLDTSINYGAITPHGENPFVYVFKGVLGGYDAVYSHADFYYSNHSYGEVELRDMWEYELKLSKDQKKRFVDHTWEILGMKFPYYFFADNCAYRIAELIEVATEKKLNPSFTLYSLPYGLFDKLHELDLLKKPERIESRQTRLTRHFITLPKEHQSIVKEMVDLTVPTDHSEYQKLDDKEQSLILDTLINYYSFLSLQEPEDEHYKLKRKFLLRERISLPSQSFDLKEVEGEPAHKGQRPTEWSLGFIDSETYGAGGQLHFRGAYYDLLSPSAGRAKGSELHVFNLHANVTDEKIWLQNLDFFSVTSLNLSQTGLRGDGGMAWNGKLSLEEKDETCLSCLSLRGEGGLGKGWSLLDGVIFYHFLNIRAQTENTRRENLALIPKASLLLNFNDYVRAQAEFGHRFFVDGEKTDDQEFSFKARFGKAKNWDTAIEYSQKFEKRLSLSFSYYL